MALELNGTCASLPHPYDTDKMLHVCYEGWSLPVNRQGTQKVAQALQKNTKWDAILHLGLENTAKGLKVETMAMNVLATENNPTSNVNLHCTKDTAIHSSGPCLLATTAPLNEIQGFTASDTWSRDTGAYYCNEIYYRTLWAIRENSVLSRPLLPAVFVHLPSYPTFGVSHPFLFLQQLSVALILNNAP